MYTQIDVATALFEALLFEVQNHCDFRKSLEPSTFGETTWNCDHDLKGLTRFCTSVGLPPDPFRKFCHDHGGGCDCEILFNMNPEECPQIVVDFSAMLKKARIDPLSACERYLEL